MGALMVLIFVSQTISALVQLSPPSIPSTMTLSSILPFDLSTWTNIGTWLAAAETAAWRLKWVMIPLSLLVLFSSRKLYRSIQQSPMRFCAVRYARNGYLASAAVTLLVLILIGVTVPTRLEHRQWGIEAGIRAQGQRIARAQIEYQEEFGTLPSELSDLRRLPDSDGSLASALKDTDAAGYKPFADMAAVPKQRPQALRGAVISKASLNASDEPMGERISFTNYDLLLPGADKILGTEDDLLVRDGVVSRASETPRRGATTTASTQNHKP
jgi:hypothetical protein